MPAKAEQDSEHQPAGNSIAARPQPHLLRKRRESFEKRLRQNPAIRHHMKKERTASMTGGEKLPAPIARHMQDPDLAEAVQALRRLSAGRRRGRDLQAGRHSVAETSEEQGFAVGHAREKVAADLRSLVHATVRAVRKNSATPAYAEALRANADQLTDIAMVPDLMGKESREAIRYLGGDPAEVEATWRRRFAEHRQQALDYLDPDGFSERLAELEKAADISQLPVRPGPVAERSLNGPETAVGVSSLENVSFVDDLLDELLNVFHVILSNPFYFLLFGLGLLGVLFWLIFIS